MNFYEILQVPHTATKYEIKKAYHKLAVQYHPDKYSGPNAEEKFLEIKTAYDILYDDDKRQQYDSMTNEERAKTFDLIKQYFTEIRPQYSYIYEIIINILYSKNEDDFKEDINEMNIKKIFSRIGEKIRDSVQEKHITVTTNTYDLYIKLKERYINSVKVLKIGEILYKIPCWKRQVILEDTSIGQVTINIICFDTNMYQQLNNYDLLIIQKVSLSQYLYGSKIKVYNIDNEIIPFEFDSCLEKKPIFCIDEKGFICNELENRGKLYIYVVIEGVNWIDNGDSVGVTYANTVEETIKIMFPAICL